MHKPKERERFGTDIRKKLEQTNFLEQKYGVLDSPVKIMPKNNYPEIKLKTKK